MAKNLIKKAYKVMYVAIRKDVESGKEWMDVGTIDLLRELIQPKIDELNKEIPSWAKVNPVQRIVEVEVREI